MLAHPHRETLTFTACVVHLPMACPTLVAIEITKCVLTSLRVPLYPKLRMLMITDNAALAKIGIHPDNRVTRLSLDNNALTELPLYCFTTGPGCSITANGNAFWFAAPGATMRSHNAGELPVDRHRYLDLMRRVPSARFPFPIATLAPPAPHPIVPAAEEPAVAFASDVFSPRALAVVAQIQGLPKMHTYTGLDTTIQTAFSESAADLAGRLAIEWVVLDFLRAATGYEQILFVACLHGTLDAIPRFTEINQLVQARAAETRRRWWGGDDADRVAEAEAEIALRAQKLKMPAFLEEQALMQFRALRE